VLYHYAFIDVAPAKAGYGQQWPAELLAFKSNLKPERNKELERFILIYFFLIRISSSFPFFSQH
jgi:hypothetical protein